MLVGVISDTHLKKDSAQLSSLLSAHLGSADLLLHAGDFADEKVLDHFEFIDDRPFFGVAGNCDSGSIRSRLPGRRILDLEGFRVGMIHSYDPRLLSREGALALFGEGVDVVVSGHTHRPLIFRDEGVLFLNPGSAFDRRGEPTRTVALLELSPRGAQAKIVELGP